MPPESLGLHIQFIEIKHLSPGKPEYDGVTTGNY